jgi:hypothetical protein
MTFEELLDHAIAMLQQRRRLTYRTLKLHFQLDDEQLAALKDELLYSQPQVVDDAGCGLIWSGDTTLPLALAPLLRHLAQLSARKATRCPSPLHPSRRAPQTPNAASAPSYSVLWSIPRLCRASSIPKCT